MGIAVFPAAASGPTLAEITTAIQNNAASVSGGNSAGWRRTSPGGLTLVASGNFSSLTTVNTVTISSLSGYSFYRLFVIGYFNSEPLQLRINSNSDARYEALVDLGSVKEYRRRDTSWRINISNAAEYNSSIVDIEDADSANYKFAKLVGGYSRGSAHLPTSNFSWSKAEAISSMTLFTLNGNNFTSAGYDGQGYYLYGGY